MKQKIQQLIRLLRYHLFETDKVLIDWPDFHKGILLLLFALLILPGHLLWYLYYTDSPQSVWLSQSYYEYRLFTTICQIVLTLLVLLISCVFSRYKAFRSFMGWFIPLYFGLLLMYSALNVGLYSPAAIGGLLNIVLIGFVFYKPKVIYSILVIVSIVFVLMCYFTATGAIPYAPIFSDALNNSKYYRNPFWIQSMAVLYLPILVISAGFFEILLRQWRRREKIIENLSKIDGLTNVYNRRYMSDYVQMLHSRHHVPYAMIIMDLDYFKTINDGYGHEAGDEVLRQVAQVLKNTVRVEDVVGRVGGEEFVLILPRQNLEATLDVAERCRGAIEALEIVLKDHTVLRITASFGVQLSQHHACMDDVARLADQALYVSKKNGRNRVSHELEQTESLDSIN